MDPFTLLPWPLQSLARTLPDLTLEQRPCGDIENSFTFSCWHREIHSEKFCLRVVMSSANGELAESDYIDGGAPADFFSISFPARSPK